MNKKEALQYIKSLSDNVNLTITINNGVNVNSKENKEFKHKLNIKSTLQTGVKMPNGIVYSRVEVLKAIERSAKQKNFVITDGLEPDGKIDVSKILAIGERLYLDEKGFLCIDVKAIHKNLDKVNVYSSFSGMTINGNEAYSLNFIHFYILDEIPVDQVDNVEPAVPALPLIKEEPKNEVPRRGRKKAQVSN